MASQGAFYPATSETSAVAGTSENAEAWVSPSNISSDNGATASITAATYDSPDISDRLLAKDFRFVIPPAATIDGVQVEMDRNNAAGAASDNRMQLLDASGAIVGNNNADLPTDWPAALSIVTYGSSTTTWGVALTPAIVNDRDFGVAMSVQADAANTDVAVDFIRMTVFYTNATFAGQRSAIIQGLDSAQAEANGWNAEVRDKEVVGAVVRTSDTVVTITLSAAAAYNITATETITVTVPDSALLEGGGPLAGDVTFTVSPTGGAAAVDPGYFRRHSHRYGHL